jgi:hypothetical protein
MELRTAAQILHSVPKEPAVIRARKRIDDAQQQLDRVTLASEGTLDTKRQLYQAQYLQLHATAGVTCYGPANRIGQLSAIGGLLVTGASIILLPQGMKILSLGLFFASLRWVPKKVGNHVYARMIDRQVSKGLDQAIACDRERASQAVTAARKSYEETVKAVSAQMIEKAERQAREKALHSSPDAEVKVEEQHVQIGGIVVPRNSATAHPTH